MYVMIARFDCACHEGITHAQSRKVVQGVVASLKNHLKCSVQRVDSEEGASPSADFSVGLSMVFPDRKGDMENQFSRSLIDLIERKGEVEVHNYLCTVVDVADLISDEDLITVH